MSPDQSVWDMGMLITSLVQTSLDTIYTIYRPISTTLRDVTILHHITLWLQVQTRLFYEDWTETVFS